MKFAIKAGIIFFKPSGNVRHLLSQTGSTDNPFFDPDKHSTYLSNNHYVSSVDFGSTISGSKMFYNRTQPSNGAAIIVANGPNKISSGFAQITGSLGEDGFPALAANGTAGPGVDVYSPGTQNLFACGDEDGYKNMDSHSLFDGKNFDTQSVLTEWSSKFPQAYNASVTSPNGSVEFSKGFSRFSTGASAATPQIAGLIACFLQLNPDANVKDVRNFLKSCPALIPTASHNPLDPLYLLAVHVDETGSFAKTTFSESYASQLGPGGCQNIAHLPQSSPTVISVSGSVVFENFHFTSSLLANKYQISYF